MTTTHHFIRYWNGQRLSVAVTEGHLYRVQPAQASRDGRLCRIEAFDSETMPRRVRVRYEDTGRVGIGTTTPQEQLAIAGTTRSQSFEFAAPKTHYFSISAADRPSARSYSWFSRGAAPEPPGA